MSAESVDHGSIRTWSAAVIVVLFLVWLGLLATGLTTTVVEVFRPFLPPWFPTLNLVLLPILVLISAASSPIRAEIRLVSWALALCSVSTMYLSYKVHPIPYFLVLTLLLIEAFLVVPRWNSRRRQKLGLADSTSAALRPKSRALDYLVYVLAGVAVAACLVYAIVIRR